MRLEQARLFEQQGTLQFDNAAIPLNENEWDRLETLVRQASYQHIIGGDAGEGHSVHVCRFYNDINRPLALHAHATEIRNIVMSPRMLAFYRGFTRTDALCLRRCQANRLHAGDFIGVHRDQDSNPDYFATVVFHFGSDYRGGAFVTHGSGKAGRRYRPAARTVLVNNCAIPHEVTAVEAGERWTLACFLSRQFGSSRHRRQSFHVV